MVYICVNDENNFKRLYLDSKYMNHLNIIDTRRLKIQWTFWGVVLVILIFLTLNKNSKSPTSDFNYQSEAWADKGGYYVYLPWIINFHFDATNDVFEDYSDELGNGFAVENDKLRSKYSVGVAFMQLPFYLLAHIHACILYDNPTGFEKVYFNWMGVGSVIYLWLGLLLVYHLIRNFLENYLAAIAVFSIFLGTNLYYYAIDETLMTHVYSFFCISYFMYIGFSEGRLKWKTFWPFFAALIVILRPTNVIFLIAILLWKRSVFFEEKKFRLNIWTMMIIAFAILPMIAQLSYWFYAYGVLYPIGYKGEGFTNWSSPNIIQTLFEPRNGWSPYAVTAVLSLIFGGYFISKEKQHRKFQLFIYAMFLFVTIMTASWWTYDFGCGLGARNFVDYSSLWMIMLAIVLFYLKKSKTYLYCLMVILTLGIIVNLQINYHFDNCWFGENNWDWNAYFELMQ